MSGQMDETAESTEVSAENLDDLAATYTDLEPLMGDTSQQMEMQESSILQTALAYAGLQEVLGETTDEEEEQEKQSSFLSSGLFFLASMVGSLIMKYTALGGILGTAKALFFGLSGAIQTLTGLSIGGWLMKIGGLLKSGIMWALRGLLSIGSTLLSWGASFISWLAAGSSAALGVAAAIGFVIGMFAVWILEITGVIDWIMNLGSILRDSLPGWARDGIMAIIGFFVGGLALLGALVLGFVEGGFSGAWDRASQIVDIFFGAFQRTFNRLIGFASGILDDAVSAFVNFKDNALGAVTTLVDSALSAVGGLAEDLSETVSEGFAGIFNAVIPAELEIPEFEVGGETIDTRLGSYTIPSVSIGGDAIELPQLEEGGLVEETGLAQVHEGEAYIPRDVRQDMGGGSGGTETKNVTINVGGIEMGDQSLDLSRLSTRELQNLAEQIADILGTKVDTIA